MSNKMLASLQNAYGDYCVDIFARPDGSFGFEEYRRDPEDGVWRCLHRYSSQVFDSEENALAQAEEAGSMVADRGRLKPVNVALIAQPHPPEALYRLFRSAMEPHVVAARGEPWNDERERAQFFEQLAPASVQVIVVEEQLIGFVDLRAFDDHCVVHTMVVAPRWQSSGVGSNVLELLKMKWNRISLGVLKSNPRARRFYERAGFREVGSTEHHYQMAWASS
jgi:RimJ/RimL family protein N-acetyltransferase